MIDLSHLNNEINQQKAETLSLYGRKVDLACELISQEELLLKRNKSILAKIEHRLALKQKWKKKKILECLKERMEKKIARSSKKLNDLINLREKYIAELKQHREILGLYDHTFIDNFYQSRQ